MTDTVQTGVRLQDGETVRLALRRTSWLATFLKIITLGLYIPWWRAAWFVVTDDRRIAKQGILGKVEIALPLHFVQDASVHRTWLGVGRVEVSTAGGEDASLCLEPLRAEDARRLADTIIAQARRLVAQPRFTRRAADGLTDDLVRLADLRDKGALTDAEFAQQKARLLRTAT